MTGIQPLNMFGTTTNEKRYTFAALKPTTNENGDQSKIWRVRSFDETRAQAGNDNHNDPTGNGEPLHDNKSPGAPALHTSFDCSLLENNGVYRSTMFDSQSSWDDEADPSLGDLSGRKHLLPPVPVETVTEMIAPGTIRKKIPRRTPKNNLSGKTPGRPRIHHKSGSTTTAKKFFDDNTPSSAAKRRRAPLSQLKSPIRHTDPLTPALPLTSTTKTPMTGRNQGYNSVFGGVMTTSNQTAGTGSKLTMTPTRHVNGATLSTMKSTSRFHNTGTTAASTHLETTLESDSVETTSPTTTRFKFTSFPASLPRVNNPRNRQCPDSVRKRMSFGESNDLNDTNPLKDDDGTHNTSISSLSGDGGAQHLASTNPPAVLEWKCKPDGIAPEDLEETGPAHAELFPDEDNFGYSDEDADDSSASPVRGIVGRTRLNFNLVLTPPGNDVKQEAKKDQDANMDLGHPYDQRRTNSFPSSLSSNTQLNSISGIDESGAALTPSRPVGKERPGTPKEVQLHFGMETQCSPIPGIPEERCTTLGNLDSATSGEAHSMKDNSFNQKSEISSDPVSKPREEGSTASESTGGKMRRLRPMPDMSAFESAAQSSRGDRSHDDSATIDSKGHSSPRLLCPPTPVRTPAWASDAGAHALFGHRQNSLITTKVLLSCPSQVLEGRSSLESSFLDDESKASGRRESRNFGATNGDSADEADRKGRGEGDDPEGTATHSAISKNSRMKDAPPAPGLLTPKEGDGGLPSHPPSSGEVGSVISFAHDFDTLSVLGSGAFADVYKVRFRRDNRLYAIKRNRRQFRGKRDRDMALAEVRSMQRLQSVCAESGADNGHHNERQSYSLYVLFFFQAWQEDGYFFCQTELCSRDTCRELIDSLRFEWNTVKKRYPSLLRNLTPPAGVVPGSDLDISGRSIPNTTIWKLCHDVAAGLSHIHSLGVVHHDIKPSNVFFVPHVRFGAMCKIGDFGMAGDVGTMGEEGDTKYMPPELLSSGTRLPSADIFSLGLTLYEVAADHQIDMPSEGPRWHNLREDKAPDLPSHRGCELIELIKAMTNPTAGNRPTADSILTNARVKSAGHGCDYFLGDYIRDVEEFDKAEEARLASYQSEDQTPRTSQHRVGIRSPSFTMILPSAPNLLSPPAKAAR